VVMRSFTSNSDKRCAALLAGLAWGAITAVAYTLWINPEISFWKFAYEKKLAWSKRVSTDFPSKTVFAGGSSCAFQIDASFLTREAGIPAVNMGMHAGMGSQALLAIALTAVNPVDTVVVAIEPGLLKDAPEVMPFGWQMLFATGAIWDPRAQIALGHASVWTAVPHLRPGLAHCVAMTGKGLSGKAPYRYSRDDVHDGGEITTGVRMPCRPFPPTPMRLNPLAATWLDSIAKESPPLASDWAVLLAAGLTNPADCRASIQLLTNFQSGFSSRFLRLGAPELAIIDNPNAFADTPLHMTPEAMRARTIAIAARLRSQLIDFQK